MEKRETPENKTIARFEAWLKTPSGKDFYEALGMGWPSSHDTIMAVVLSKIPSYFGGAWRGYKDAVDRYRCDTLMRVMHGEPVEQDELRMALALMLQAYNGACERIHGMTKSQRRKPPIPPRPMRPYYKYSRQW